MARRNSRRERRTPNLKRGKYQREPKRRFILFCEGKNTEPAYFRAIERVCTSAQIEVQVEPAAGVPYTIAEKAVARAKSAGLAPRSRRVNSFEESEPSVGGLRPRRASSLQRGCCVMQTRER